MPVQPLPDPESLWKRAPALASVHRSEVERRVGTTDGPIVLLPGGHANVNLKLGDRVLRIFRRDPQAASREARLLAYGWKSFRVPRVFRQGPDFLLLEYVPHAPVPGTERHGSIVGCALAEIHQGVAYLSSGFLDARLDVQQPFPDLVTTLVSYARAQLLDSSALPIGLREQVTRALEARIPGLRAAAGAPVLLHADFKPSNLHWTMDDQLLVLDWEFAYAGAALSDIGQLLRWRPPEGFIEGFADGYGRHGGRLIADWRRWASMFDLVNLAGLLANGEPNPARVADIRRRLEETLENLS
jgi:hypothetical protein